MRETGIGVIATGFIAALIGLFIDVGRSAGYGFGQVANLHAMHIQSLLIIGGLIFILTGAVLFAGGTIHETLQTRTETQGAPVDAERPLPSKATDAEDEGISKKTGMVILTGVSFLLIIIVVVMTLVVKSRNASVVPPTTEPYVNSSMPEDNGTIMEPMVPEMNVPLPPGNRM